MLIRKIIVLMLLLGLLSSGICYAQDTSSGEITIQQLEKKIDQVLKNQKEILKQLKILATELNKVKIRISR